MNLEFKWMYRDFLEYGMDFRTACGPLMWSKREHPLYIKYGRFGVRIRLLRPFYLTFGRVWDWMRL